MNDATNNQEKLLYRTLLMCKITGGSDYRKHYRKINDIGIQRKGKSYITIGGFDALCVYSATEKGGAGLHGVLNDRKRIVTEIDENVSYHPIHLVQKGEGNSDKPADNAFLLVVFVYGIEKPEEYDEVIAEALPGVEIYHCINISDRVLLYYTEDIGKALVSIDKIEENKKTRKMYTTVNIPLKDGAEIDVDALEKIPLKLSDSPADCAPYGNWAINIRGSIKTPSQWNYIFKEIKKILPNALYFSNYGEDDFVISSLINGVELKKLLILFIKKSEQISQACWDIHTEFQIQRSEPSGGASQVDTADLLLHEYKKFCQYLEASQEIEKPAWMHAYKELFNVHRNLDKHPILKGPAYMLYDCLNIANCYFTASPKDIDETYKKKELIPRSQEKIERFLRSWSHITDQLVRNDDVVFYGIGRSPAIAATLPENLLEFYHAFLREVAEHLRKVDESEDRINQPEEFRYGFLLSPDLNQRMRVSELFDTPYTKQICANRPVAWPNKQVYIMQFPLDDVFRPMDCFLPLVHECFHKFGEAFRCRHNRLRYMVLFLSFSLSKAMGYGSTNRQEFSRALSNLMMKRICKKKEAGEIDSEPFMQKAQEQLGAILYHILSDNGWGELYEEMQKDSARNGSPIYLYYPKTIDRRDCARERLFDAGRLRNYLQSPLLKECTYYFRECYADFMAIRTLSVTPREYIRNFFLRELQILKRKGDLSNIDLQRAIAFCQRIAVVLAAYQRCGATEISDNEIADALTDVDFDMGNTRLSRFLADYYNALTNKTCRPPEIREYSQSGDLIVTPCNSNAAMETVVDYLLEVDRTRRKLIEENREIYNRERDLVRWFDRFIRKEQLFEEEFIAIIQRNRSRIEEEAKRTVAAELKENK